MPMDTNIKPHRWVYCINVHVYKVLMQTAKLFMRFSSMIDPSVSPEHPIFFSNLFSMDFLTKYYIALFLNSGKNP